MKNLIQAAVVTLFAAATARAQCIGDIVPDGRMDGGDLGVLLAYWGPSPY